MSWNRNSRRTSPTHVLLAYLGMLLAIAIVVLALRHA
jgi:hypothetical protein